MGLYPSVGADWRTDVRCQDTGDPTAPTYREWTHKEIWDLITLNGVNADPRDVHVWVRDPDEIAGEPASEFALGRRAGVRVAARLPREGPAAWLGSPTEQIVAGRCVASVQAFHPCANAGPPMTRSCACLPTHILPPCLLAFRSDLLPQTAPPRAAST